MGEFGVEPLDNSVFLKIHQKMEMLYLDGHDQSMPELKTYSDAERLHSEIKDEILKIGENIFVMLERVENLNRELKMTTPLEYVPNTAMIESDAGVNDGLNYISQSNAIVKQPTQKRMLLEPHTGIITEGDVPVDDDEIIIADDRMLSGDKSGNSAVNDGIICADKETDASDGLNNLYDL